MQKNKIIKNKLGFTIIELLIATAVFSTILLLCTFGLIKIGRSYYKGITSVRTQNAAREIMDNITQAIQYEANEPVGSAGNPDNITVSDRDAFCIGKYRYSYQLNKPVGSSQHGLVVDPYTSGGSCDPIISSSGAIPLGNTGKELLGENMRLMILKITKSDNDYDITLKVTYAVEDDLIDFDSARYGNCRNDVAGSEYCASSTLQTTVHRRVTN